MIDGARVLALVTARGGSKGLPGKNLALVGGQSLVARAVHAARAARHVDRVIISSDDPEIVAAAVAAGAEAPFRRPAALARDDTPSLAVVRHALAAAGQGFEWLVLLQPTSPLRTAADIDGALALAVEKAAPFCVSVTEAAKSPFWSYTIGADGRLAPVIDGPAPQRRQELPEAFALNGAVYVGRCERLLAGEGFLGAETVAFVMPRARSLDIDDALDLALAQAALAWLERGAA